jgi:hypothetical protein
MCSEPEVLKKSALFCLVLLAASFTLVGCSQVGSSEPRGNDTQVFASQDVSSLTATPGLVVIDGEYDIIEPKTPRITAGTAPGYMEISPELATLMVFDSATNNIDVVNTQKRTVSGAIPLPGPTTSMVVPSNSEGYAAVPSAPVIGFPPGALEVLNLSSPSITASISVPSAQTVVSNPGGSLLLVFSNDSNALTVVNPAELNTGGTITTTVSGFDRPVNAVFTNDGATAYILNCGPQCGGTQASVQTLNMATLALGTPVPVDAATIGLLDGPTLYVAGSPPTNNACTGQVTAAKTCGRLDAINVNTMTVASRVVITDGYHDRIDLSSNGQLFIGSYTCTNIGNVNAVHPSGEVRGCLSIFNTTIPGNTTAIIPPDNGDVTGFQSFSTRNIEYVAEGGNLRVYDTSTDSLQINFYTETGTIVITGQIIDVKAVDFL